MIEEVTRGAQPLRHRADAGASPFQKSRTVSRNLSFHSAQPGGNRADLIAAGAAVPRFGNELNRC